MKTPSLLPNRFIQRGGSRGIAVIYIALLLIALLAFVGLAIDIGYMYVAKTQLQNAADAAALAGAAKLTGETDSSLAAFNQVDGRQEAWKFACKNKAATANVYVETNASLNCDAPPPAAQLNGTANSDSGDIIVGNWDATTRIFTRATGSTALAINALQVKARRTQDSPGGKVNIFFGRVINYPTMAASSSAIAVSSLPGVAPIPICLPSCSLRTPVNGQWNYDKNADHPFICTDSNSTPPGQKFFLNPSSNDSSDDPRYPITGSAWTNFFISECFGACNTPNPGEVTPYLMGKATPPICNKRICTSNGSMGGVVKKEFTDAFNTNKKTYTFARPIGVATGPATISVQGWKVLVPVVSDTACGGGSVSQACPGDRAGDPYVVQQYAKILITEIIDSGQLGFRAIAIGRNYTEGESIPTTNYSQTQTCGRNTIVVNRWVTTMDCVNCADTSLFSSSASKLVK
jgi:Flp pilus assembly protein TadG